MVLRPTFYVEERRGQYLRANRVTMPFMVVLVMTLFLVGTEMTSFMPRQEMTIFMLGTVQTSSMAATAVILWLSKVMEF